MKTIERALLGIPASWHHTPLLEISSNVTFIVPQEQLLPAKYNEASQLKLVVDRGQKSISRDFELTP